MQHTLMNRIRPTTRTASRSLAMPTSDERHYRRKSGPTPSSRRVSWLSSYNDETCMETGLSALIAPQRSVSKLRGQKTALNRGTGKATAILLQSTRQVGQSLDHVAEMYQLCRWIIRRSWHNTPSTISHRRSVSSRTSAI